MNEWRYVYSSVAGSSHLDADLPCQDFGLVQLVTGSSAAKIILAASDGAGSATESAAGANIAVSTIVARIVSHLAVEPAVAEITKDRFVEWVAEIADTIGARAYGLGSTRREHACTLLGAVVDESDALFFQIGDGAVVIGDKEHYEPVFWPQSGEYANTTNFVTDDNAADRLAFELRRTSVTDIAVFTDGLQSLALRYATRDAHAPFFTGMFAQLRAQSSGEAADLKPLLIEWLSSNAVNRRTGDDKTLLLATRSARD